MSAHRLVRRQGCQCATTHGVVTSLADYDVTPAKLTALKKKIDAFDGVQSEPCQATASSKRGHQGADETVPASHRDSHRAPRWIDGGFQNHRARLLQRV